MKKLFSFSNLLTFQLCALLLWSCQEDDFDDFQGLPSFISSVSAMEGCVGDTIVIKGQNIDDCLIVMIDGIPVLLQFLSEDEASFVIPESASSGNLVLEFNDGLTHEVDDRGPFTIIEKTIDPILTGIESIRCFDFSSPKTGYYSAGSQVMKTTDGGASWSQILSETNSHPLYAVDANQVWLNQVDQELMKSENGGVSWESVNTWHEGSIVQQLSANEETALLVVLNEARKTELLSMKTGTAKWETIALPEAIADNSEMHVAYHLNGTLKLYIPEVSAFYTRDSQNNWSFTETDYILKKGIVKSMQFFDDNSGLMLTNDGYLYTYDGGRTWDRRDIRLLNQYDQLLTVHFFNQYDGMIVTKDKGILKTSDGGVSWQLRYLKGTGSVLEADFLDEDKSVIVSSIAEESSEAMLRKITY